MKTKAQIGIGDAIEVRLFVRTNNGAVENWYPATVCHSSRNEIGAAFADGQRLALTRYSPDWRVV